MGVKSVRFNAGEEKALDALTRTLHMDTSGVIKKALWELYEELQDRAEIEAFEARENSGKTSFSPIDDLLDRPNPNPNPE
jgi:predicted transcriptional regulator